MLDTGLTLKHAKLNFQLAVFTYPMTYNLEPSTFTRKENRLDLKLPSTSEEIANKISAQWYIVLNTEHNKKSDFAVGLWYSDEASTYVEAFVVGLKRKNNPTLLQLEDIKRGTLSQISFDRLYPKDVSGANTLDHIQNLRNDRANFMMKSYCNVVDMKFKDSWKSLADGQQLELLVELDKFASTYFPGLTESLLVDCPLGVSDMYYVIYINSYNDLVDFASLLKLKTRIAQHLEGGFSNLTICNHTSHETLESPQTQIRRS